MKNLFLYIFAVFLFFACSSTENKEESKSDVKQLESSSEQTESDEKINSSDLLSKHYDKIEEAMFFHIREKIEGLEEYRILKSEKIKITENRFEYLLVTLPYEYLRQYQEEIKVLEAGSYNKKKNVSADDSTLISGEIIIDSIYYNGAEQIGQLEIHLEGKFYNSYNSSVPYIGPERKSNVEPYAEQLLANVSTPKIYPKDQYYLKARIQRLTEADLHTLSNDELGYLRNEIFARHGHTFKTDKMSSYFAKQDWYEPYVDDATPWLNETEKWNAQYIKTFEN